MAAAQGVGARRLRKLAGLAACLAAEGGTPTLEYLEGATLVHLAAELLPSRYLAGVHLLIRREVLAQIEELGGPAEPLGAFLEALRTEIYARRELTFQDGHWFAGEPIPDVELTDLVTPTWRNAQ